MWWVVKPTLTCRRHLAPCVGCRGSWPILVRRASGVKHRGTSLYVGRGGLESWKLIFGNDQAPKYIQFPNCNQHPSFCVSTFFAFSLDSAFIELFSDLQRIMQLRFDILRFGSVKFSHFHYNIVIT
ncbi:hypothetical protein AAHA92_12449 [Salvia divinorum]|uniref:Uncharacterized protein n=1 Tax=Salvia divinorum TaxID=28513 RepID=A0ABD1HL52_SALDI